MTETLLVAGTASHVGKSTVVAGLLESLRSCLVDGYENRDTAVEVHERRSNDPCSGATGEVQKPFCTRAVKSQAMDSPPNSFSRSRISRTKE